MKISYIAKLDINNSSGVLKKIITQISYWEKFGHTVKLFLLAEGVECSIPHELKKINVEYLHIQSRVVRFFRVKFFLKKVINWQPDAVYLRHITLYPGMLNLMNKIPTVLEVQTNDIHEYRSIMPAYRYYYYLFNRNRLFKNVSGIVSVTNEINNGLRKFKKKSVVISNGIDLSRFQKRYSYIPCDIIRAAFIGSPNQKWHGIDKIHCLAGIFKDWRFDIIGTEKKEVSEEHFSNLIYHGRLERIDYNEILVNADVVFGTLALHRNDMNEACPLKVREYLAYGIPTIIGYFDTDFYPPPPFILQLPNCENNIINNTKKIFEFVMKWKGRRVPASEVFCLDISLKEKKRLNFIHSISVQGKTT